MPLNRSPDGHGRSSPACAGGDRCGCRVSGKSAPRCGSAARSDAATVESRAAGGAVAPARDGGTAPNRPTVRAFPVGDGGTGLRRLAHTERAPGCSPHHRISPPLAVRAVPGTGRPAPRTDVQGGIREGEPSPGPQTSRGYKGGRTGSGPPNRPGVQGRVIPLLARGCPGGRMGAAILIPPLCALEKARLSCTSPVYWGGGPHEPV